MIHEVLGVVKQGLWRNDERGHVLMLLLLPRISSSSSCFEPAVNKLVFTIELALTRL